MSTTFDNLRESNENLIKSRGGNSEKEAEVYFRETSVAKTFVCDAKKLSVLKQNLEISVFVY
jgi:hypothetical protein